MLELWQFEKWACFEVELSCKYFNCFNNSFLLQKSVHHPPQKLLAVAADYYLIFPWGHRFSTGVQKRPVVSTGVQVFSHSCPQVSAGVSKCPPLSAIHCCSLGVRQCLGSALATVSTNFVHKIEITHGDKEIKPKSQGLYSNLYKEIRPKYK